MTSEVTALFKPSTNSPQKSQIRLYYELNRLHHFPTGAILIFWPFAWALAMVAHRTLMTPTELLLYLILSALASTLLHGTGCIINDIFDRDIDRLVERSKTRPLASGAISMKGAIVCFLIELAVAIAMLSWISSSIFEFAVGFIIFPLIVLYPLMKRITHWPQAWLGLPLNWGFIFIWATVLPSNGYIIAPVFFMGSICWTIFYDTIYACQDKEDDIKTGVKSTALLFGNQVRPILFLLACVFVGCIACAGYLNQQGWLYYVISVGGTSLHLLWQLATLQPDVPADCWEKFKSNGTLGLITFAGMVADYLRRLP